VFSILLLMAANIGDSCFYPAVTASRRLSNGQKVGRPKPHQRRPTRPIVGLPMAGQGAHRVTDTNTGTQPLTVPRRACQFDCLSGSCG